MPAIVDFPELVYQQVAEYGDLFANEPEQRHFAEYLTGLYMAERKNVSGINRGFAVTTDQSCLNRWLTNAIQESATLESPSGAPRPDAVAGELAQPPSYNKVVGTAVGYQRRRATSIADGSYFLNGRV